MGYNPILLFNPYSILLLSTALINLSLAAYALRYRKSPGSLTYSFLMALLSLYSFGYAFELQAASVEEIYFWLKIEYLGIAFLPPLFIILALLYTGLSHLLKPWLIVPLFMISFTTLFLQFTNYGNLFYLEMKLNMNAPFPLADFVKGPWYWAHQVFVNLMLLLSSILYIRMFRNSKGRNRIRALIMVLALDIPWGFYVLYLIGGSPYNIDLSPFSFSVAGILTALGIFRYHLLEYVPLALENVFNSMTDGVVIIDEDRCLVGFNPSAVGILPELSSAMKGKPIDGMVGSLPSLISLTDGFESDIDISHHGNVRYFHMRVVAVKTERKRLTGWAIIFTNITERKLKENALLDIEKKLKELNLTKDKFFAIIAHDLRNAFHLIINMADMIQDNIDQDNKQSALRKGKIIYETSVTTYNLLQNLLDWALMQLKGIPFKPVELLLIHLIQEEIKNLKTQWEQKELNLRCTIDKSLKIKADEEMLKTVFRNLISNAIKYSHPGGTITINATVRNGQITVEVCDNGVGMTQEEQNNLFKIESYFSKKGTASENGTGLGLKLCKEFIGKHGGEIWVNSAVGKGSTFYFSIPSSGPHQ